MDEEFEICEQCGEPLAQEPSITVTDSESEQGEDYHVRCWNPQPSYTAFTTEPWSK